MMVIMIQLEYFKHQCDRYFIFFYNLAMSSSCLVLVPKLLFGT